MKRSPLKRSSKPMAKTGKKARRHAKGDKAITARVKGEPCAMSGLNGACYGDVVPAHIIGRDDRPIRDEPLNIIPLCAGCHSWLHANPAKGEAWIESRWPGRIETLRILSRPLQFDPSEVESARKVAALDIWAGEFSPPQFFDSKSIWQRIKDGSGGVL